MDFASWGIPNWSVDGWGMTPLSLAAPLALITVILMGRRLSRQTGPKLEKRDVGDAVLITTIIGAAFLWVIAGLGLLARYSH
jgi:hypothetical protein